MVGLLIEQVAEFGIGVVFAATEDAIDENSSLQSDLIEIVSTTRAWFNCLWAFS